MHLKYVATLSVAALFVSGCASDRNAAEKTAKAQGASNATHAYGWKESGLGYRAATAEHRARGPEAVAVGPNGQVLVLDAMNERVVQAHGDSVTKVATVPKDADDLAIGPDGAFAVRRSTTPQVLVFDKDGALVGAVDTSAVEDVSSIGLGVSRRVTATNGFQETFLLGSPAVPQLPEAIRANKREGAVRIANGDGVLTVKTDTELTLQVVHAGEERTTTIARHALGQGVAARIVGVTGNVVCARVEHLRAPTAEGALSVLREAVCLDAVSGAERLRTRLPDPGAYVPRRELTFANGTLALLAPTESGVTVTTWNVGGAR